YPAPTFAEVKSAAADKLSCPLGARATGFLTSPSTLSHFDFLFGLVSFCTPSPDTHSMFVCTAPAIFGIAALIGACTPPVIKSTFPLFFFSNSFLSISRFISASISS
uniref:Uncharacterized protein n=1 Tax=Oryza brachyantha TaxID=4533 RepID=J3L4A2_ORYBR